MMIMILILIVGNKNITNDNNDDNGINNDNDTRHRRLPVRRPLGPLEARARRGRRLV